MDFGKALLRLKDGIPMYRKGWATEGLFVFAQVPAEISMDTVPKMQSLPKHVKDVFISRQSIMPNPDIDTYNSIYYGNQLALVDSKNNISGWSPSTPDVLATDWDIYVI